MRRWWTRWRSSSRRRRWPSSPARARPWLPGAPRSPAATCPGCSAFNCPRKAPTCRRRWPSRWPGIRRPGSAEARSASARSATSSRCLPSCRTMPLSPEDLARIAAATLANYNQHAGVFREGTRDHDVSQNIDALLRHIEAEPPFEILDFGCGPGLDLKTFRQLGHHPTGLEGAARLAAMAREHSGCEVLEQSFLQLDLPSGRFDGVFANAALFHVPTQELP